MRIAQLVTVALILVAASVARAEAPIDVSPTVVKLRPVPYVAIAFATEGPAHSFSDGNVRGKYQRLVVLNLGLAYDRPTLRLETLTYGDENCCRRLIAAWELNINDLTGLGLSMPDAATNELRFVRWRNARTAEFRYGEYSCQFQGVGLPKLKVSCVK